MASGSQITATDLSSLRNEMNTILNGTGVHGGYSQSHTVSANPSTGGSVDDAYHDSLYSAATKIANFYNITNTFTAVDAGTVVNWTHMASVAPAFITAITDRFDAPWSYTDWDTSVQGETSQTASDWNGSRTQIVKVAFADVNTMNAWFAAGGELRITASHAASGGEAQGASWAQLASELGTFTYSVRPQDSASTDARTRYKHSDLTTSYVEHKREHADASDYSANYISVLAKVDGSDVYIQTVLNDAHVADTGGGSGYGGPWSWTGYDSVPGTSTVAIASKRMTNPGGSVNITNPTWSVTDAL